MMEEKAKRPDDVSVIEKFTQMDREATKFDFDKLNLSQDTENGLSQIPQELISEALNYNMNDYYASKLAERKHFFKKLPVDEIMKWGPALISRPLLKIPQLLHESAIQIYKNLLSYMGDRKSGKKPIQHIKKHLKLSLNAAEDLKDEAFVQILKQIKNPKDYDKGIRGWNMMAVLASCYAPSSELFYSLLNYLISEIKNSLDQNIVKRCNYIIVRLAKSFESKRKQLPSDEEILHIENMKSIMFPVFFFSESHTMVPTESYTTVNELKTTIMRKIQLSISRIPYYSLYEICNKKDVIEERFLDDSEKIVDVTALWHKEMEDFQKRNEIIEFKIYLKIQLYYEYKEEDVDTITMHFVQTNYDVRKGIFHLTEKDIAQLAAIQLSANWGNISHQEANKYLEKNLEKYIPSNHLKTYPQPTWIEKVMEVFTSLKFSSKLEAKLTYLEHLKQNNLWEAHQYFADYSKQFNSVNSDNLPDHLILGLKPTGIIVCDHERNELMTIPYTGIASWGVNNYVFVVVIQKNENDLVKYYFESNQTKMFQLIIESYTNLLTGKSITEILSSTYNSIKRFDTMGEATLEPGQTLRSRTATSFKK